MNVPQSVKIAVQLNYMRKRVRSSYDMKENSPSINSNCVRQYALKSNQITLQSTALYKVNQIGVHGLSPHAHIIYIILGFR